MKRLIFAMFCLLLACADENAPESRPALVGTWRVYSYAATQTAPEFLVNGTYDLTFRADGSCSMSLDVNTCSGIYVTADNSISISLGCTKIFGDSEFAEAIKRQVPQATTYSISNNELLLADVGYVRLKRIR